MGYHVAEIPKGKLGEASKITEEYHEFIDSLDQSNPLMAVYELSDMIGAIEAFAEKYNFTLEDLIRMKNATKRAFADGTRS